MADARLSVLIELHMLKPFVWGESDCCLAVCNVLRDLGWPDPAEGFRGLYNDEAGARGVMVFTVEETASAVCRGRDWFEVPAAQARDGDVGVHGRSLMIHCGGWWHGKSPRGYVAKRRVRRAWRPI